MTDKEQKELKKAIKDLTLLYEQALQSKYIYNPLAFALYHTWKKFDGRK